MKSLSLFFLTIVFISNLMSQSCLPQGIHFYTQHDIDSFSVNYPNCSKIAGSVFIDDTIEGNIQNLLGLSTITCFGRQLSISNNDSLINLAGLESLDSVGLNIILRNNKSLLSIANLESLTYVNGMVGIQENNSLQSLEGLENLDTMKVLNIIGNESLEHLNNLSNLKVVKYEFLIENNQSLSNLSGLESLIYAGEDVKIFDNDLLIDLNGLNNLQYIRSVLKIRYNDQLSSLDGLENLDSVGSGLSIWDNNILTSLESISNMQIRYALSIYGNPMLEVCDINSICEYLSGNPQYINIYDNAPGCNSQEEVEIACDSSICLPYGVTFSSQAQIDSFPINYPGCAEIVGHVIIAGNDITNVDSLYVLTSINGYLQIGDYMHPNSILTSLLGFENLTSIRGDLIIGFYEGENSQLASLAGLDNLLEIGGLLGIGYNPILECLSGLDNIRSSSIMDINIIYNQSLSTCEVKSVCDYIGNPNGNLQIHSNAIGCNTITEVEEACTYSITEQQLYPQLSIYPNPFTTSTTIEYELTNPSDIQLIIYNTIGEVVYQAEDRNVPPGIHKVTWSPTHLPSGLYYGVLRSEEGVSVVKMVKK